MTEPREYWDEPPENHPGSRYGTADPARPDLDPETRPAVRAEILPGMVPEGLPGALPENTSRTPPEWGRKRRK